MKKVGDNISIDRHDNDLINFEFLHAKIKHLSESSVKKSL